MADLITRQPAAGVRPHAAGRALLLGAALLVAASGSGCTALSQTLDYHDGLNEWMIGYRNRALSAKAWHREKHRHCRRAHLHDFCRGFRQGYEDVADGGNGCTPAFPPREYWGWRYQSPTGQGQVGAWFAGYPLGAKAAEEDGVGYFSQIQTSASSQQEYLQHGLLDYEEPVPMAPETIPPGDGGDGVDGELPPPGASLIEGPIRLSPASSGTAATATKRGNKTSGTGPLGRVPMPPMPTK